MMFRRMKEDDLLQVCSIENETFSIPWSFKSFRDSFNKGLNLYFVAEENNIILAYCGVWVVLDEGQINNIAVKKERQGQGIGSKLLRFLLEEGSKQGILYFSLEVRKSNERAIALYQNSGFEIKGQRPSFYDKPKEDALIMTVITSRKDFD